MRPGDELVLLAIIVAAGLAAMVLAHLQEVVTWAVEVVAGLALIVLGVVTVALLAMRAGILWVREAAVRLRVSRRPAPPALDPPHR